LAVEPQEDNEMKCLNLLKMLILGAVVPWAAVAGAQDYTMHARVSVESGESLVKGLDDADWSAATVNTLLLAGDTLWVDEGGTSEIEFPGGTFLRGADGTKLEMKAFQPAGLVRVWNGSLYVQRLARAVGDFTLETPATKISIDPDTNVRIDVVQGGATTVSVRWGRVTVRANDGSGAVSAGSGTRVWVDPGMLPSSPVSFDATQEDPLDSWNRERAAILAGAGRTAPKEVVIESTVIGASDLDTYGEWVYVDNRPLWRPTVVVNYVPYRHGYWSQVPTVGYCWTGAYPFSYVTTHYGRWHHTPRYGWCWSYDPVWSPAWVATVRAGDYFVWSPIGYDYRPVYAYGTTTFTIGGVAFGITSTSYVPYGYVNYGPRYVYGCYPEFGRYTTSVTQINVWNINIGRRDPIPVPYTRPLPVLRDYNPPRSIRGLDVASERGYAASDRVRALESRVDRSSFAADRQAGSRSERTYAAPERRSASTRSVNVRDGAREAGTVTRASTRQPMEFEPRIGRAADPTTGRPDDSIARAPRATRGGEERPTPTYTNEDARGARPIPQARRTEEGNSETRSPQRGGEAPTVRRENIGRTALPAERDSATRAPGRATAPIENDSPRGRSEAGERERRSALDADTPGRTTPRTGGSTVTPTRTRVPSGGDDRGAPSVNIRGRTPSGPSIDDTPQRRRAIEPQGQERRPTAAPSNAPATRTNTNILRDEPRGNSPVRSESPRIERSAPAPSAAPRIERSAPRESYSPAPRVSAPPQQREMQRSAPQVQQREYSAPAQRAPQPRMSAPQAQPQPRMSAPQVDRGGSRSGGVSGGGGRAPRATSSESTGGFVRQGR